MKTAEKYQQIKLMAQMSGKSFLELKTYYDCKETSDSGQVRRIPIVAAPPKTAVTA